jgi:molecular chaperone IbpA
MAMRTFDIAPLYRSTVGFERLFDLLDNSARPDWPPYNIEKKNENEYGISMAVAGFSPDEIELTQHGTNLLVSGQKKTEPEQRQMLHQGIAFRNFKLTFNLADHVKVQSAQLQNGLLSITLSRAIPEELKPRHIAINSPGAPQGSAAISDAANVKPHSGNAARKAA